jgi:4-amino-4-deoxy-L-arabinose transferase-like glycosyltransferase
MLVAQALAVYAASRLSLLLVVKTVTLIVPGFSMIDALQVWDGQLYLAVVEDGYPSRHNAFADGEPTGYLAAFFPLFPLLVRLVGALLPVGTAGAGVVTAFLAGGAATVAFALLAREVVGREAALRAVALFCFFPGAFVLSLIYAEGVLITAAALCLLFLLRERWLAAGVAGALATAARPNGIAVVAACAVAAVVAVRRRGEWRALLAPALAPVGMLGYFGFLWARTGDAGYWYDVQQRFWGNYFDFGADAVRWVWAFLRDPFKDPGPTIIFFSCLYIVAAVAFLWKARLPLPLTVFAGVVFFITIGSAKSFVLPRFCFTAFPALIAIAVRVRGPTHHSLVGAFAILMAVMMLVSTVLFLTESPVAVVP